MTGKRGNDDSGWRRGACGIDGDETVKLARATDYTKRGIAAASFGEPMTRADRALMGAGSKTWAPTGIRQGTNSNRAKGRDSGTSPGITAASDSGKYASRGIKKYMQR